jgi:hypothetical protein
MNIALARDGHSDDAGTHSIEMEDKLAEVQRALENFLDAIEKMGHLPLILGLDTSLVETAASHNACLDYPTS